MVSRGAYVPLDVDEIGRPRSEDNSSDATLADKSQDAIHQQPPWAFPTSFRRSMFWMAAVDALLLIATFGLFGYWWLGVTAMTDHELILATNSYSPLLSRTKIELRDERIKTALLNRHNVGGPSIYREAPSPEVDEAWRKLHKGDRLFLIDEEEVRKMGKDPEVVIKAPLDWGYGEGQYLAVNQGQHDIHCLNNLRMFVYNEYYYPNKTSDLEIHALHCLHTLMQTFQCKYSTDVYTGFWVEGSEPPVVDFDLTRKCQNYENILHWSPERPYTEEQFASVRPPPGQKRIPAGVY